MICPASKASPISSYLFICSPRDLCLWILLHATFLHSYDFSFFVTPRAPFPWTPSYLVSGPPSAERMPRPCIIKKRNSTADQILRFLRLSSGIMLLVIAIDINHTNHWITPFSVKFLILSFPCKFIVWIKNAILVRGNLKFPTCVVLRNVSSCRVFPSHFLWRPLFCIDVCIKSSCDHYVIGDTKCRAVSLL